MIDYSASPRHYAQHIAKHIKDPSTIRVRTLEHWGRAPSIEQCRAIRQRIEQANRKDWLNLAPDHKDVEFTCGHERIPENCRILIDGTVECRQCDAAVIARIDAERALVRLKREEGQKEAQKRAALRAAAQAENERRRGMMNDAMAELGTYGAERIDGRCTIVNLATFAAFYSGMMVSQVWSHKRHRHLAYVRFAAWSVAKEIGHSYPMIAKHTGAMSTPSKPYDHSTVMHGVKMARDLDGKDARITSLIAALREYVGK
jgi:hypothetical protein